MTKPTDADIAQQFRDAPRLDPTGQPRSNSPIADQAGGSPIKPGRASPVGDGVPTGERLGGFGDAQVARERLPQSPPPVTTGGNAKPPKAR